MGNLFYVLEMWLNFLKIVWMGTIFIIFIYFSINKNIKIPVWNLVNRHTFRSCIFPDSRKEKKENNA